MSGDALKISRGVVSGQVLDELKSQFHALQRLYLGQLVQAVRDGADITGPAHKLAALDDLVEALVGNVHTGKREARKREEFVNGQTE